jgi:hypothetical protein
MQDRKIKNSPIKRTARGISIGCTCCEKPSATIIDGMLIWQAKHGGQIHLNGISLESLKKMLEESGKLNIEHQDNILLPAPAPDSSN